MKKLTLLSLMILTALFSRALMAQSYFFPDHYDRYFSITFPGHWQLQNYDGYTRFSPHGQWNLIYMDIWTTGVSSINQALNATNNSVSGWLRHGGFQILDQRQLNDGMYMETYGTTGQLNDGSTADYMVAFLHRDPAGRYPGAGIYALGIYMHHNTPNRQVIRQELDAIGYSIEALTPAGSVSSSPQNTTQQNTQNQGQEMYTCSQGEQLIVNYLPGNSVNIAKVGEVETVTLPFIETRMMNDYYGNGQVNFVVNFDEAWLEETHTGRHIITGCN